MSEFVTEFTSSTVRPEKVAVDMLFVPVFQDEDDLQDVPGLDAAVSGDIGRARASGEFHGKLYEFLITRVSGPGWTPARIALVGAGRRHDLDVERIRRIVTANRLLLLERWHEFFDERS